MRHIGVLTCLILDLCIAGLTGAETIASFPQDVIGGNADQGTKGWYYLYAARGRYGSEKENLLTKKHLPEYGWDVFAFGGANDVFICGNGVQTGNEKWPVLRWASEVEGDVYVTGFFYLQKASAAAGFDGVTALIRVNGKTLWSQRIQKSDVRQHCFGVVVPAVKKGDNLDFVVNPMSNNWGDLGGWNITINSMEGSFTSSGQIQAGQLPDYRKPIDRSKIDVRTICQMNPWWNQDYTIWGGKTPDRPTLFNLGRPDPTRPRDPDKLIFAQYKQELRQAETCNIDVLMMETVMENLGWWHRTLVLLQAADSIHSKTKVGLFLSLPPEGKTTEEKKANFIKYIELMVTECDKYQSVWRIEGKPVVMMYRLVWAFSTDQWRQIQARLQKEGKDCVWLISGESIPMDWANRYMGVVDGVAHYANYSLESYKTELIDGLYPWLRRHYPTKLIYAGVENSYCQAWNFADTDSQRTGALREMCDLAMKAGVDGIHFTNWSDFMENSRVVPSEIGDRTLAEILGYYGDLLRHKNPRDRHPSPLIALTYRVSQVYGDPFYAEILVFPCKSGGNGKVKILLQDEKGRTVAKTVSRPFSMEKLSAMDFIIETSGLPYSYTLRPLARIEWPDRLETITGPYVVCSPDRPASLLTRSVCNTSQLPVTQCELSRIPDENTTLHRLNLSVRTPQPADEIRLVGNSHILAKWYPAGKNWQTEFTHERGRVGARSDGKVILPGIPPVDIYHLEVWSKDARRIWSLPLVIKNKPDDTIVTTCRQNRTVVRAPRDAFIENYYSFNSLVGPLVLDESGYDFHGGLGGMGLMDKTAGYGFTGSAGCYAVANEYYSGPEAYPGWDWGGVTGTPCLTFDGVDDFVLFWGNLIPYDSWTFAVWVQAADPSGQERFILSSRFSCMMLGLDGQNRPMVYIRPPYDGKKPTMTGKEPLASGQWHHLALTYDMNKMILYVDGKLGGSVTPAKPLTSGWPYLLLGVKVDQNNVRSNYFKGKLDNLFITGRPLGAAEIKQVMAR